MITGGMLCKAPYISEVPFKLVNEFLLVRVFPDEQVAQSGASHEVAILINYQDVSYVLVCISSSLKSWLVVNEQVFVGVD